MTAPIIIIGTGLAGYQLARDIRKINQQIPLTLITADDGRSYPKPQLSTALTQGKTSNSLATATAETMASQLNATIITHTVVDAIDPNTKTLRLHHETLHYDKLVLACGADVIKAPIEGNAIDAILSVNHLHHYAAFETLIKNKKKIAILGAGLIGCEFANDLSNANYEVHIIAPCNAPLDLLIPESIGKLLQIALADQGVQFHLPSIATQMNKTEKGYELLLSDGKKLEVDVVLSAIGLKPHLSLAETAGIKTQRGIVVNRYLETSIEDIYALGDCAEVEGHVLPYIAPILQCSKSLAKTLNGERTAVDYPAMPVVVKTPAHPIVVCPPPKNMKGQWKIETEHNSTKALFFNEANQLVGFVLTQEAIKERAALAKQLPTLF